MDSNYTFKIILVGDSNAGKTSYFNRLMNYEYTEHEVSTIGVDFGVFYRNINNNSVRIHLWDTAGQEKYHSLKMFRYLKRLERLNTKQHRLY